MIRITSELIAVIGLLLAIEACSSSSNQPRTNAIDPANTNGNAAGTGTTAVNAGGAVAINTATGGSTAPVATNKDKDANAKTDKIADASVTAGKDAKAGGTGGNAADAAVSAIKGADAAVATKKKPTEAEQKLLDMIASKQTYDATTIDPLYDQLDVIPSEFLIGTWKGHVFEANPANPQNWYGKRVAPDLTAEPWLTNLPDGSPGPNNPIMGAPSTIQQENFRGKVSAVLVYDTQMNRDYFRKLTGDLNQRALDDIVVGYSSSQLKYFYLVRSYL
jgi:hypothetical protein